MREVGPLSFLFILKITTCKLEVSHETFKTYKERPHKTKNYNSNNRFHV